jgi:hypothetical protein
MRTWSDFVSDDASLAFEKPKVAVMGCFQNGKSTLVNCLLGGFWALLGDGKATTSIATRYKYSDTNKVFYRHSSGDRIETTIRQLFTPKILKNLSTENAFQAEVFLNHRLLNKVD